MKLFIETNFGEIKNHPAFEDNLIAAFGEVPAHWEPFTRVEKPIPGLYQVLDSQEPTYQKINGVWTDVWLLRDMTDAEKAMKQQAAKDAFNNRPQAENWSAWVFDEATCAFVPPIPRPEPDPAKLEARIFTFWSGADNNWKDAPPYPNDGNQYNFDFIAWVWTQVESPAP